jgi:uncharacterized membrane protein/uncharacterized membrane protein YbhN (UPF0104 family)
MKESLFKLLKFILGWPLSFVALYFIWTLVAPHINNLFEGLENINYLLLTAGIFSFIVFYFLRGFIWYKLLLDHSCKISFKQAAFLWIMSEIKRYIPGKFWFILGRAAAFSNYGVKKLEIARLIIIELQIFVLGSLIVSLLSVPFLLQHFLSIIPFVSIIVTIVGVFIFILLILYINNQYVIEKLPKKIKQTVGVILPKMNQEELVFLLFISVLALLFFGLGNYFIIASIVFIHPQLIPQLVGFFTLSFLLGFLSFFTPAGLGVREGIVTIGLAKIVSSGSAAFGSLFSRLILIISELIFLLILFIWTSIKSSKIAKIEKFIASHSHEAILCLLFIIYIVYFTTTSFLRYDNFYTGRFDLGNMAQTVWNTSQGRIFEFTNPDGTESISRLGFHADFILILLSPFYYLWTNPKMLLLIQTIIVAAASFFVFLIAREVLKNKNLALIFSFVYLLNPSIERANLYDFHGITLATFFLLGIFYFYLKKKYVWFTIFAFLAAITKEEIWLITAFFGILIFIAHKKRVLGAAIFITSIALFYYLLWHAIPNVHGSQHFALSYYSDYGDSPSRVIKNIILSPEKIISTLFDKARIMYLIQLFLPVGFLSLIAPFYLIFAVPDLAINLLSNNSQLHQIYYQYTAAVSPFIFVAAIYGARFFIRYISLMILTIYLIMLCLISAYFYGPLPGAFESNLDMYVKQVNHREEIERYLDNIPEDMSIAATNNVGSHLFHRRDVYVLPIGIGKADVIIFLLTNKSTFKAEKKLVDKLKKNDNYYLDTQIDKFIVFKKKF